MRKFFLAAVAVSTVASIGVTTAPVQARDYPFCIKVDSYESSVGDCSFEQCLATASGRRAYCDANPFYAYAKQVNVAHPKKRHRSY